MTRLIPFVLVAGVLAAGCSSDDGDPPAFTADCLGLPETVAYDCLEARFWRAFQVELDQRLAVYDLYGAVFDEHADFDDPKARARAVFRRGQFALAIALESAPPNPTYFLTQISPDFDHTLELDPDHTIVVSWQTSIDMAIAHVTGNDELAVAIFNEAADRVEADPLGNVPSLSGTSIGMPLSTGVPQRTVAMVDEWECRDVAWCTENTERGPWVVPGMAYHWAEIYARVGRRDETLAFLEQAVAAPGYADWPFNHVVDEAIADVDALLDRFAGVGEDGSAFLLMYANQDWGCVFCHAP
jgi:hypothetical protein